MNATTLTRTFLLSTALAVLTAWVAAPQLVTQYMLSLRSFLKSEEAEALIGQRIYSILEALGVPPPYPSVSSIALILFTSLCVFVVILSILGSPRSNAQKRKRLEEELKATKKRLDELDREIRELESEARHEIQNERPVRIFMEGAFDIMHYGHMNAFRLGAELFPEAQVIVGVNSDETITQCKGPPVMNDEERIAMVSACRFVDEVVPRTPYVMTQQYLESIMEKYDIDYVVHGDDPCFVDGVDVYGHVKKMGKFASIPRTEGVSTTDIVGRMLLVSKGHHHISEVKKLDQCDSPKGTASALDSMTQEEIEMAFASQFLSTTNLIRLFSAGCTKYPADGSKQVLYIDGAWDMFHAGHVDIIQAARQLVPNPFIIIGVHNDTTVNKYRGYNYPIMTMQERLLSVLGCKYVDDVLIDSPWRITQKMIKSLDIAYVVRGVVGDPDDEENPVKDPYEIPKRLGIFKVVKSDRALSVFEIVRRITVNQDRYVTKFFKKMAKEQEYYGQRYGLEDGESKEE